MQPHIAQQIINAVRANPKILWKALKGMINHWCSDGAIRRWLTSRVGYKLYMERVITLLSNAQRTKHFAFAKRFRNNLGLGNGKYWIIHYDKKWFWGLVMRCAAKSCPELGIDSHTWAAYHKSHINKTMLVAFTVFAFINNSIENGGTALKLGLFWAQSHKIAKKMVRKYVRQPDGQLGQMVTLSEARKMHILLSVQ
jgi:hypothetical protein